MNPWFSRRWPATPEPAAGATDPLEARLRAEATVLLPSVRPDLHQRVMEAVATAPVPSPAPATFRFQPWWIPALGLAAMIAAAVLVREPVVPGATRAEKPTQSVPEPLPTLPALTIPESTTLVHKWIAAPLQKELADLSADARAVLSTLPLELVKL